MPKLLQRKKLRATTARRSLAGPEMDYEEMSEPNMKLSRALLIVLVLHVVAVAGIVAFNTIKTRQGSLPPIAAVPAVNKAAPAGQAPMPPPMFRRERRGQAFTLALENDGENGPSQKE